MDLLQLHRRAGFGHSAGVYVPADKLDRFAANYNRSDDGLKHIHSPGVNEKYHKMPAVPSGDGGLVGTAGDYMRFLLMIAGGGEWNGKRHLSENSIELMTTNQLPRAAFPICFGDQIRHGTGFSFGFSVRTADTEWVKAGRIGEYGRGGAASTHYWVSPEDDELIVVTAEQHMPYNFNTEWLLKSPSELVTIADTLRRWIREANNTGKRKPAKRGRPRTKEEIRQLILKLARENDWGYTRILGELRKLGIQSVSRKT